MVIQAIYENGVFRPIHAIELPDRTQVNLEVQGLSLKVNGQGNGLSLAGLAAIAHNYPSNDDLPADSAAQHNHYLRGLPKQV
jgi:hypothetical protein